jgi:hypothetical protein
MATKEEVRIGNCAGKSILVINLLDGHKDQDHRIWLVKDTLARSAFNFGPKGEYGVKPQKWYF